MPKKKAVTNSADKLARRLSYAASEDNAGLNGVNHVNSQNISNKITRQRHGDTEITRPELPTSGSRHNILGLSPQDELDPELRTAIFPKIICIILAAIAAYFLFGSVHTLISFSVTDILYPLFVSLVLGAACAVFSWMVTFSDSLEPGSNPPSPMSPQKLRKHSGHTFHSSYVICIANGVIAFAVSLWYFSQIK